MAGEKNIDLLLAQINPELNDGIYVFCTVNDRINIDLNEVLFHFKEHEGVTIVLHKNTADRLHLQYQYIASWITLKVHSALDAVGFTAAFSQALALSDISCNVVAGYYHDHIFVPQDDTEKAMLVLQNCAKK